MSYANFKATIWSAHIQTQLENESVFKPDCDFQFEGEAKKGERVKILGVARPTLKTYAPGTPIDSPETPKDTSTFLTIDQYKYFNYGIDDIDKAQARAGLMEALSSETTRTIAEDMDRFIAKEIATGAKTKIAAAQISTEAEAKDLIDEMFVKLWSKGVSQKDKVTIYLTPWMYNLFKNNIISLKTDNDKAISTGLIGSYNMANVKMTNLIYNDGTNDHIVVKTSKGYAFANGINETEAYRPQDAFMDAIKGLNTYGGKAVRPEQIVSASVHQ